MSLPKSIPDILNSSGLVKICGLRTPELALAAAEAGADLIGLLFARSRRQVTVDQAGAISEAVRETCSDQAPAIVGVFVDSAADEINQIVIDVGLDIVQLHGDETLKDMAEIDVPIIRALGLSPESTGGALIEVIRAERVDDRTPALYFIDAYDPVNHGGTGRLADWRLASEVALQTRMMLAGGLDPENVENAIRTVRPFGVDVSSGVERDGVKDPDLIRAFIANAKRAFATAQT